MGKLLLVIMNVLGYHGIGYKAVSKAELTNCHVTRTNIEIDGSYKLEQTLSKTFSAVQGILLPIKRSTGEKYHHCQKRWKAKQAPCT